MTLSPALTDDELDEEEEVMNLNDENAGSKDEDDVDEEEEEDEELELQRDMLALQQKRVEEKGGGKRDSINDEEGLEQALASIRDDKPWLETLDFVHQGGEDFNAVEDDGRRESLFLAAARAAATASIKRLEKAGVKFRRPEDYYAEMCKTDKHMAKVKDKLIHDKKNIEQAENRRKLREQKKFGKQIQHAKEAEKREKKKENQEAVKKWRTDKKSLDSGDFSLPNEDLSKGSEARDRKRKAAEEASEDRKKAKWTKESKDAKYGFGKKTMKRNRDGSGLDDFVGVSGRGGSGKGGGKGKGGSGKGKGGKGGAKRPGKSARDKGRR